MARSRVAEPHGGRRIGFYGAVPYFPYFWRDKMSNYEQNEWVVDMDDALAPLEEPEYRELSAAEFDAMLKHAFELKELERKAIEGAKTSWRKTAADLDAIAPGWRGL